MPHRQTQMQRNDFPTFKLKPNRPLSTNKRAKIFHTGAHWHTNSYLPVHEDINKLANQKPTEMYLIFRNKSNQICEVIENGQVKKIKSKLRLAIFSSSSELLRFDFYR